MKLFEAFNKNKLSLINHIVMAPMTRARSLNSIYNAMNAEYYAQRSGKTGAGLIITEGTTISPTSSGVLFVPGIYTPEMIEGAKFITQEVNKKGSKIFAQLWHVGRVSHITLQPDGLAPLGPSDITAEDTYAYGYQEDGAAGFVACSKPRAFSTKEVKDVIQDFAAAAKNAISAGFDGVEIHGANGYLIEQFLNPLVNNRTDEFGGNIENRVKFLLEVVDACIEAVGAEKVGVRLSPYGRIQGIPEYPEEMQTFQYIAKELSGRNISFVHLMNQVIAGKPTISTDALVQFRSWYNGVLIYAGGLDKKGAEDLIKRNVIDLAAFGQPFISNPDLTSRMENDQPLIPASKEFFYGGGKEGYIDYPGYQEEH